MRKIYVTGLGVISGIGKGVEENLDSLKAGKHGMGKITLFPTALDVPVSEVKQSNEELKKLLSLPSGKTYSRTALLGLWAAQGAARDAELDFTSPRIGSFLPLPSEEWMQASGFMPRFREDNRKGRLRDIISHDCGSSTEMIAAYLGVKGTVTTLSTACSSAANAIMLGARLIRHGLLDAVLVGGTDALCRFTLNGFNSLMILDKEHCRPFDRTRAGLNLGEGAGYLVLQSDKSLTKAPYCELSGYANANEAYHQTGSSPDGDGPFLSMSQAIASAGADSRSHRLYQCTWYRHSQQRRFRRESHPAYLRYPYSSFQFGQGFHRAHPGSLGRNRSRIFRTLHPSRTDLP